MLFLIGSIILTSYLTLSFKVLERFRIPVLQSIVLNHWVCVIVGAIVNGEFPVDSSTPSQPWFIWSMVMGTIFIVSFNLIAWMTQRIGVAVTSVANKMSLVVPFIFSIYLYNEKATFLKIFGVAIALIAILFTCWPQKKEVIPDQKPISPVLLFLMPAILFSLSGFLDTIIKYVEQEYLNDEIKNTYLITCFVAAASIGTVLLVILFAMGKQKFDRRTILAGIAIGIPNYFSIWCLVRVLKDYQGDSSSIIPINNMGIVLFSSVVAYLLFRERLSGINWIGILLSMAAIALIAYG